MKSSFLQGGSGGDGGNGKIGKSNLDQIPNNPTNAQEVVSKGLEYRHTSHCDKHCGGRCKACDDKWYHKLTIKVQGCPKLWNFKRKI